MPVLAFKQKAANFTTIFDGGSGVIPSYYENCSAAANVRVFDSVSHDVDWSTYTATIDPDRNFTILLATYSREPRWRFGALLMMALCDVTDGNDHAALMSNFTFKSVC